MAGKGTAALILGGVAAFMLMPKKKRKKAKKKVTPEEGIVAEGSVERTSPPDSRDPNSLAYQWRVTAKSASIVYVAEIGRPLLRDPDVVKTWKAIGEADNIDDAKEMAIAAIEEVLGYEPELEIIDSGTKLNWEWRFYADPERGAVGQYRLLPDGRWESTIEAAEYTEQLRNGLWAMAQKAWQAAQG